jgi:hypothetical protein
MCAQVMTMIRRQTVAADRATSTQLALANSCGDHGSQKIAHVTPTNVSHLSSFDIPPHITTAFKMIIIPMVVNTISIIIHYIYGVFPLQNV